MNIFALHDSPTTCARMHCDRHVLKMIIEYGQLLATATRMTKGQPGLIMLSGKMQQYSWRLPGEVMPTVPLCTHIHHPCQGWVKTSPANYEWLWFLMRALLTEYTKRYFKEHSYERIIDRLWENPIADQLQLPDRRTSFVQCMPAQYRGDDPVQAYRDYYAGEKARIAQWKMKNAPEWFSNHTIFKPTMISDGSLL